MTLTEMTDTPAGQSADYMPTPPIPTSFVLDRLVPSHADVEWATTSGWFSEAGLQELKDAVRSPAVALESPPVVRARWLRLAAAWLYWNRGDYADPWAEVERLWEAFDHAEELSGLIRWMSVAAGEPTGRDAMLERWRTFAEPAARTAHAD